MRFRRLPAPLVLAALVPVATGLASSHPAAGEDAERPLLLRVADAADPGRDAAVAAWKALTEIERTERLLAGLASDDPALALASATVVSPWRLDLDGFARRAKTLRRDPLAAFAVPEPLRDLVEFPPPAFGAEELAPIWAALATAPEWPTSVDASGLHRALLPAVVPTLVPLLASASRPTFLALLDDLRNEAETEAGDERHDDYVRAFRYALARLAAEAAGRPPPGFGDVAPLRAKPGLPAELVELARACWGPAGRGLDLAKAPPRAEPGRAGASPTPPAPAPAGPSASGPVRWLLRWALRTSPTADDVAFLLETVQGERTPSPLRWWAARRLAAIPGRATGIPLAKVLDVGDDASLVAAAEQASHGDRAAWDRLARADGGSGAKRRAGVAPWARWLADPAAARDAAVRALAHGDAPAELAEAERWYVAYDVGVAVRDEDLVAIDAAVRKGTMPVAAEAWWYARAWPDGLTPAVATALAGRWAGRAAQVQVVSDDLTRAFALVEAAAPEAALALARRWAAETKDDDVRSAVTGWRVRLGDVEAVDAALAAWTDAGFPEADLVSRLGDPRVEAFLREQAASSDVEVESRAVAALAAFYGLPEGATGLFGPFSRREDDLAADGWAEAKALVLGKDPVAAALVRTAKGPNVGQGDLAWTAGLALAKDPRVAERMRAWRDDRASGLWAVATACLALQGDAEAKATWRAFLGQARTFLLDDVQEPTLFTLDGDPDLVADWVGRLDANCCLGWHAGEVLRATFPTLPAEQAAGDAGRARRLADRWFARHRGSFVRSRVLGGWVPVPK